MEIAVRDGSLPMLPGANLLDTLRTVDLRSIELQVDPDLRLTALKDAGGISNSLALREELIAFHNLLQDRGVHVCALLLATDFSSEAADEHVRWSVRAIRAAAELGVPVVRLDTFTARRELPADVVRENLVRCLRRILDETETLGVDLGIENHAFVSNDPAFLDGVFADISDPRLGLTLDTGNFYWFGHPLNDVYRLIKKYAGRTHHTHIKSINYPADKATQRREIGWEYKQYRSPLDEGNLDLSVVVQLLMEGGYRRDLCIENEALSKYPEEQRLEIIRRDVAALRKAIAAND